MAKTDLFHGKSGKFITHDAAKKQQDAYLAKKAVLKETNPIRSQFFGIDHIKTLIAKPDCVGVKIYYTTDENGGESLVLVAANKEAKTLEKNLSGLKDPDDGDYLAHGPVCPVWCENSN